jgi:hypothetical protein
MRPVKTCPYKIVDLLNHQETEWVGFFSQSNILREEESLFLSPKALSMTNGTRPYERIIIWRLKSSVSCLTSHVSCLMSHVSNLYYSIIWKHRVFMDYDYPIADAIILIIMFS